MLRPDPGDDVLGVVKRGRERVLGREPVLDVDDGVVCVGCDVATVFVVGAEHRQDESAAAEVYQDGAWLFGPVWRVVYVRFYAAVCVSRWDRDGFVWVCIDADLSACECAQDDGDRFVVCILDSHPLNLGQTPRKWS